ncbi:MAG: beta-lactamase family protein [Firmicutes bacterium]|nr:beta-lactamase family protein [Bacillota bacterium]
MRFFRWNVLFALLMGLLVFAGCSSGDSAGDNPDDIYSAKIQSVVSDSWNSYKAGYPGIQGGLAVRVLSDRGDYYAGADMPVSTNENTHFRAASITKTFTSAAIMLLQQRGLLNIDDKITGNIPGKSEPYLPDTSDYNIPYKSEITIKQLLQHRAGVFDVANDNIPEDSNVPYAGQNYLVYVLKQDPYHTFDVDELAGVVAVNGLYAGTPGEKFSYSDTGYSLLGRIIERVSGMSYGDFVTSNLLETNNLNNSTLPWKGTDQTIPSPFITGYDYNTLVPDLFLTNNISFQVANGNIISTTQDLSVWAEKLYTGKAGLRQEYVNMITDTLPVTDTFSYGLGCYYIEGLGYGHSGGISGYLSFMIYDPQTNLSMTILSNVMNWDDSANQQLLLMNTMKKIKEVMEE